MVVVQAAFLARLGLIKPAKDCVSNCGGFTRGHWGGL